MSTLAGDHERKLFGTIHSYNTVVSFMLNRRERRQSRRRVGVRMGAGSAAGEKQARGERKRAGRKNDRASNHKDFIRHL
jgi:ribosomal protein L19E